MGAAGASMAKASETNTLILLIGTIAAPVSNRCGGGLSAPRYNTNQLLG